MATKKKARKERRRPTDKVDCLYRAVQEYVESCNGSVVVAGPIALLPGEREMKFGVVVWCVGRPPARSE